MKLSSKKGFSLVELIIVIAIMGIIAVVAVPNLMAVLNNSKIDADNSTASEIAAAAQIAYASNELDISDEEWKLYSDVMSEAYISGGYTSSALPDGLFYVKSKKGENGAMLIAVAVGKDPDDIEPEEFESGDDSGIVYVSGYSTLSEGISAFAGNAEDPEDPEDPD